MSKLHIYEASDGWRWRLKARNGRIVADSGEAYSTRSKARAAAASLSRHVRTAKLVDETCD